MSTTLIRYTCQVCGGALDPVGEHNFKCRHCGSIWEKEHIDDFEKILEKFDTALREQRAEDLAKLARRRYEETRKENVSNTNLESICNEILNKNPDDFYSQFYLATCKEDYSLPSFLNALDVNAHYYAVEQMLEYLIRGLQARWIHAVSTLIEKAYKKNDIAKYNLYRTKLDDMAERVEEGIFEPGIPRDIFIAYSSQDMGSVNELLRVLEDENGLSCFVAARNLRHGSGAVENYQAAINTALENCKAVVFVSSQNSRSLKCEAMKELAYIKKNLPDMWRIELLINDYRGTSVERVCKDFFADLEYCTSPQQVADRYTEKYMLEGEEAEAKPTIDIEAEIQRKLEEALAKQQAEAEAKRLSEAEAKRKAEAEAEARRKFEEETRRKLEAEYAAKMRAEAEARRKAEAEAEAKRKAEEEAKRKAEAEAEAKRKAEAEAEAKRKAEAEAEAKRKAEAEAETASPLSDFAIENGVLKKYKGTAKNVVIPNSVTRIGDRAFLGCSGLTSITIPNSVTRIGQGAFWKCSGLTSIIIPSSVTSIGEGAFYNCSGLTSITIPDSVTSIDKSAFWGCSGLTSIIIPNSVTSIEEYAFSECSGLTSITIPSSVTSIGFGAFSKCSGLTSITIPNSVTRIGNSAFVGCSGLTSITIPDSVTSIGDWAFSECSGLTSITIPSNVKSIGDWVFSKCSGLTSITIPDSVTSIGNWAFSKCSGLTSITIPDSVTSIGQGAFWRCDNLKTIYCEKRKKPFSWHGKWHGCCKAKVVWGYKG